MNSYIISSGQTSSGLVLNGGDSVYVLSGGKAIATLVGAGANEVVQQGGLVVSSLLDGGTETIDAGGLARSTLIESGGTQVISAGGLARDTSVGAGGTEYLISGATISTVVASGGFEVVDQGGSATHTEVDQGGVLVVLPGGSATATQLSGGTLQSGGVVLLSGNDAVLATTGIAFETMINAASVEYVLSGGHAVSAMVSGGVQEVFSGGTATGTVLLTGLQDVFSGGVASATIASSGTISVQSGGVAAGAILQGGGELLIAAGGFARETVVSAGGSAYVFSGGSVLSSIVDNGGRQFIDAFGVVRDTLVGSGGIEVVGEFGSAEVTEIAAGGEQFVSGGSVDGTVVQSGGVLVVDSGMAATGVDIQSGGMMVVLPGGSALASVVEPGGHALSGGVFLLSGVQLVSAVTGVLSGVAVTATEVEYVLSGGTAGAATVAGLQYVYSAGVARDSDVIGGGLLQVYSAGVASGTQVQSGGTLQVALAGNAVNTTVLAGGQSDVLGGVVTATVISSGGVQLVEAGSANATLISAGGLENVEGGGTSLTQVQGGATQYVQVGVTRDSVISSGGFEVVSAGIAIRTDVQSGGTLIVLPDGKAVSAQVQSGGHVQSTGVVVLSAHLVVSATNAALRGFSLNLGESEYVLAHGIASGGTDSAVLNVASGGVASSVTVRGLAEVLSGGLMRQSIDSGTQIVSAAGVGFGTQVQGGGLDQVLSGGVESQASIAGFGSQTVFAGGTADSSVVASGGVIDVQSGGLASGTDLQLGATMVLEEFGFIDSGVAFFDSATDMLTVSGGGISDTLQLSGDYTGERFVVSGGFGLNITAAIACYCHGTLILTDAGDVAVENLSIGDRLVTRYGGTQELRWIGTRSYAGRFAAGNRDVLPIRIGAGSLGEELPRRDLWVSPLHAMYLDGLLIPAWCLVNGNSIIQAERVDEVSYYHLELADHHVIFAEGAASESYIEDGNRGMFHNAATHAATYPDAVPCEAVYCAPRVEFGPELEAVRRRLSGATRAPSRGALRGWLDVATRGRISGWALDDSGAPSLRILDGGVVLGEVFPKVFRRDVQDTEGGDGICGFEFVIDGGLDPAVAHVISVVRSCDGAILASSPVEIAAGVSPGPTGPWRGQLDQVDRHAARGWAECEDGKVGLQVLDNGVLLGHALANRWRADVAAAGMGDGRQAFEFVFPGGLSPLTPHVIEVRREADGAILPGSPIVIPQAGGFSAELQKAVSDAIAAADANERSSALNFLIAQTEGLLQQNAVRDSRQNARQDWAQFRRGLREQGSSTDNPGKRALIIDAALPRPTQDAGSQALLSHMRTLQALGYEVSTVAAGTLEASLALAAENIKICAAPFYSSVEDVLRRQAGCFDVVYLHRAAIAQAYLPLARHWQPHARILYAVADLHHLRLARAAALECSAELERESSSLHLAECSAALMADAVLTHSPVEAAILRSAVPRANVHVVPWIVPARPTRTPFVGRAGVAFIGHYGHAPNIDAACYLVDHVMPLVWSQDAGIVCTLAGSAMAGAVRQLARPGVRVLSEVADLSGLYNGARLMVAPLRYGAGIKGKVLESFAHGVPCVMSTIAAEGLALPPPLAAYVAPDAAGLASLILALHQNRHANRTAGEAGLEYIRRHNDLETVRNALERAVTPGMAALSAAG